MREFRFRAWDTQKKCWFVTIYEAHKGVVSEMNIRLDGRLSIREMSGTIDESIFEGRYVIMQWTGLTDKNGVDIYEGDIVIKKLVYNRRIKTVGSFKPFLVEWKRCGFNLSFMDKHTCEVVGNVFENAELLE